MIEEDLDWLVYHVLLEGGLQESGKLAVRAGCLDTELTASLARLESSFLIVQEGTCYRVLSVPEIMLASQARHNPSAPFVIEGGVIRERKSPS